MSEVRFHVGGLDTAPILTLYGDGSPHETVLTMMSGWHETPDSKSPVTERDSGDGAYDIDEGSIAYSARVAEFDYRLMADSRGRMHAVRESMLLLAGRLVTVRVVDDDDDTFAVGSVSISKDKSAQNINSQTETGTITVEMRNPVRFSSSSRTTQLFPPSATGGGLSFGVRDYDRQWTGTPNASPSRLLDDGGNVIATNLAVNPKPIASTAFAGSGSGDPVPSLSDTGEGLSVTSNNDGTKSGDSFAIIDTQSVTPGVAYHINATLMSSDGPCHENGPLFLVEWKGDGGVSNIHTAIGGTSPGLLQLDFTANPETASADIRLYSPISGGEANVWAHVGLYTAADWQAMQEAGITWFDGDSQSPAADAGLGFPLDYGVVGSGGDTNLLLNGGSYRAYPILTVSGVFPDGVLLEHDSGALCYEGPVGVVPLVLDCRTGTAHMGGADVTRRMSRFDWPSVPAGGSLSLRLLSSGSGWVDVESRDSWM